jgi:hypothetical protein
LTARRVRKLRSGCWIWGGAKTGEGYGALRVGGVVVYAHRLALARKLGRPLRGLALHRCGRRDCVRPAHLYEGTHSDNLRDAYRMGTRGGKTR